MEFEIVEFWRARAPAHIDPDHAAGLACRIMRDRHGGGESFAAVGRLGRRIDAFARDIELPAVEDAAQPVLLVAREGEGRAAMRALPREHADAAVGRAKGDEVLAEE